MAPKPQENIASATNNDKYENGFVNNAFESDKQTPLPCIISNITVDTKSKDISIQTQPAVVMDFDDLLPHIGDFGLYQKILFLLMIPFAFFVAFVYFSQIFMTLVPEQHWCKVPELAHLSLDERFVTVFLNFIYFKLNGNGNGNPLIVTMALRSICLLI